MKNRKNRESVQQSLPTTGQVLRFLLKCFGELEGKGIDAPTKSRQMNYRQSDETQWAKYKRIERLAQQCQQSNPTSEETKAALIDAVAALFDNTLKGERVSSKILEMSLGQRIQSAFPRLHDENTGEKRFTFRLIFWIVYFIEHHEWLRPQLESAHAPDDVLWEWIEHVAHFYTNTLADTVRVNPTALDGLPKNLSWNLPTKLADGSVKWPLCHAFEWLESIIDDDSRADLPSVFFPNDEKSFSKICYRRILRGKYLPGLDKIENVATHRWNFKHGSPAISPERLKAVLLWCRALQFALKKVEKHFHLDSVWLLVEWHNRATASHFEFIRQRIRK